MTKIKDLRSYPNMVLTINKFMTNYYNINGENLNKVTHSNLKEIFPFLNISSLEEQTEENITMGNIILVIDSKNKIKAYNNPYLNTEEMDNNKKESKAELIFVVDDDVDILDKIDSEVLKELNIYELEKVLKLSKAYQDYKMQKLVQKELYFRTENHSSKNKTKKLERIKIREIRKDEMK